MQKSSGYFKDEIIGGISLSLKYLQHMQAEATSLQIEDFGITKENPHLQNLATYLDLCFSFGLSAGRRGYWSFVKCFEHSSTCELVETHKLATTEKRKGYIWLFLALSENTLGSYINLFTSNKKKLKEFYKNFALLRDAECCEILKTLLRGLDSLTLTLDINNPYLGYESEPIKTVEKDVSLDIGRHCEEGLSYAITTEKIAHEYEAEKKEGDLAEHLRSRRRKHKRQRQISGRQSSEAASTEEDTSSMVESIGLEDDHYIPEVEDSTPITIGFVLPDNLHASLSQTSFVKDDKPYNQFLLAYSTDSRSGSFRTGDNSPDTISITEESTETPECTTHEVDLDGINKAVNEYSARIEAGDRDEEDKNQAKAEIKDQEDRSDTEETEHKEYEGDQEDVYADGRMYKITYVTDEDLEHEDSTGERERVSSIDSFDQFCREHSETINTEKEHGLNEDGSDQEFERTQLEDSFSVHDEVLCQLEDSGIDKESELQLMELSPHSLPKESITRVMNARMDTSIGILLPTLPRRPAVKEAAKLAQDFSANPGAIVTLSLEVFEDEDEQFGKMFNCFVGSLHGIHEPVKVVLSNRKVYVLEDTGNEQERYNKITSFTYDSINKIQTCFNFQDVNILLDTGMSHLWTCDEIVTRNMITSLKSGIRCGRSKGAEEEPLGQHLDNWLTLILKDFLLFIEGFENDLLYFGIVQFCPIIAENPDTRVVKSGHLMRKQNYLGVVGVWDQSLFSLRGHMLYEYAAKDENQVKQVLNLRNKCGGCVRVKDKDRSHMFRIYGKDGVSSILDLAADCEEMANDWIMSICLVMADAKMGRTSSVKAGEESLYPCGIAVTKAGVYTFQIQLRTGKVHLIAMVSMQDITRVCVDNIERNYCLLLLDSDDSDSMTSQKSTWVLQFTSELELGKFEQNIYAAWHVLYQIPLQFVLLADGPMKRQFKRILEQPVGKEHFSILDALRF